MASCKRLTETLPQIYVRMVSPILRSFGGRGKGSRMRQCVGRQWRLGLTPAKVRLGALLWSRSEAQESGSHNADNSVCISC